MLMLSKMDKKWAPVDNTSLARKVVLRNTYLPDDEEIAVLDAFTSNGLVWKQLEVLNPETTFHIARIDKESHKKGFYIRSENTRFFGSTNLSVYDVIDLDHYGVPIKQMEIVLDHSFEKRVEVFVTANTIVLSKLPPSMLKVIGFTDAMIDKSLYLCSCNVENKILGYLSRRGVNRVDVLSIINDSGYHGYLHFRLGD